MTRTIRGSPVERYCGVPLSALIRWGQGHCAALQAVSCGFFFVSALPGERCSSVLRLASIDESESESEYMVSGKLKSPPLVPTEVALHQWRECCRSLRLLSELKGYRSTVLVLKHALDGRVCHGRSEAMPAEHGQIENGCGEVHGSEDRRWPCRIGETSCRRLGESKAPQMEMRWTRG